MAEATSQHLGHLVRLAQQIHTRMWNSDVSQDVTSPQFLLLSVLANTPDIDQRRATEAANLDRSTGAELIARLAARGLIDRHRDANDRRRFLLQLTQEGQELVQRLRPEIAALNVKMIELVPEAFRSAFLSGMQAFVNSGESIPDQL